MENENMTTGEAPEDPKAAKKAAKQAKKEEKARQKEEARRQKLLAAGASPEEVQRAMETGEDIGEESGGSRLAVFFVTLIIIAIWLAILALLVKMDVGGFGSTVLKPLLKDVPYINKILPVSEEEEAALQNTESDAYPFATLEEAIARIKALEIELQNEKNALAESQNSNQDLSEQSAQLAQYKEREAEFEALKQKFDEEVVFSDQAPDINEYRTFYESIDPANAEAIYKRVLEKQQTDEEMDSYVSMYSSMKPKQAAAIFDTMRNDLQLVAKILKAMDADSSSSILGAMNAETAAKLTKIMNPPEAKTKK